MKSLLARLLLVVSAAMVPAMALQSYTWAEARHNRQRLVADEALRLARLVSAEQQRIAEGADQVLNVIASAPPVKENRPAECQRLLANLLHGSPRYSGAAVSGLDGHPFCAPGGFDRATDFSDRAYFRRALQTGGFAIGDYTVGRWSKQPAIHMARPFTDNSGTVAGVVDVAVSVSWLADQLDRLALPPGAAVSVGDRNGTILVRYPGGRFLGGQQGRANSFGLQGGGHGLDPMEALDGRPRIIAEAPADDGLKGLTVRVGLDRDSTFPGVAQADRAGLLLIVLGAGLALAVTAMAGTRLFRRPLGRLLSAADRWRTGDLSARTGIEADSSEFGRLAGAFDGMAAAHEAREGALRTALESTTDGVIVLDRDWRFTYLNRHAKAALAGGRDLLGCVIWDVFPEDPGSPFADALRTAAANGGPAQVNHCFTPLGAWFEVYAYPSEDCLTVFFRDVTEERRMAAALRQTEAHFRATFEQAAVGMAQVGLDGTWLRVNGKLCDITGYAREDLIGGRVSDITHPEDLDADIAQAGALLEGRLATCRAEKRFVCKGGAVVWVNRTVSLLRDPDGRPECFIAVLEHITDRKRAEEALRESETRLQLAREAAGFGVWDWDIVSGARIWSDEQWRLHGRAPLRGGPDLDTWRESIHPGDRDRVFAERDAAVASPSCIFDTGYRVLCDGGSVRWLLAKAKVVRDVCGNPVRMVGVSLDVTASRETEAALRRLGSELEARVRDEVAAREAAQARAAHAERMHALGQLAGGIAHDFNNVLQGVAGAASLIERRPADQAAVRRLARLTLEAAERGASITRRLLAFGRRGDLRAEAVDVPPLLDGLRDILAHTLGAALDIRVSHPPDLPAIVVDKGQLETVLVNLATNARDAMPAGGRLTFSAGAETVPPCGPAHPSGLAPGHYVRLAVTDTGAGMDAATLARAGEPFFTTKDVGSGTGLGLPMARGFAEQSGGALLVESSPGQGASITLWLPARSDGGPAHATPASGTAAAVPEAGASGGAPCVLVVDDEDLVREIIAEHLEDAGYRVLAASGGAAALALLASGEAVDALVTDLSMPGMDGLALIRAAQARCPGLPAVLLTGYAGAGAALAVGGAISGAFSLLRKPVGSAQLADRVAALLASRALATPAPA